MKSVAAAQLVGDDEASVAAGGRDDGLVDLGIEGLTEGRENLEALLGESVEELGVRSPDTFNELALALGLRFDAKGGVEAVEDGEESGDDPLGGPFHCHLLVAQRPLPEVVEIGRHPAQVVEVGAGLGSGTGKLADEEVDGGGVVGGEGEPELVEEGGDVGREPDAPSSSGGGVLSRVGSDG